MTNSFKIKHKEVDGETDITLSGQLTINVIIKLVDEIKDLLKNASNVNIHVKEVENMDLTFIQMLFAIKNSGKKENFKVKVDMDLSEELTLLIKNAGFYNTLNLN